MAYTNGSGEVRYTFTGKELDGSDLYYYGARYYDPEVGRFISVDPAKQGMNWYEYCGDNPVKYVDPTGLWSFSSAWSSFCSAVSSAWSSVTGGNKSNTPNNGDSNKSDNTGKNNKTQGKDTKTPPSGTIGPPPPSGSITAPPPGGVPNSNNQDYGPKNGYVDLNFSYGSPWFVGITGGIQFDENGLHPYLGVGGSTPGLSSSLTVGDVISDSGVGHGWNIGLQGSVTPPNIPGGLSGQIGYNFQSGKVFGEAGFGGPTGGGVFGYYVW